MKTLVIINPHAGGKRAIHIWEQIEHHLRERLGDVSAVITQYADDIPNCLQQASDEGVQRIISIGGDGTNHYVVNAIMQFNQDNPTHPLTYATIPAGTGRDWARGAGTPLDVIQAVDWIANTRLRPVDIGEANLDGITRYFLNVSSVGISNDIVQRIERAPKGGSRTFIKAIIGSLMKYKPEPVQVYVDGELWWDAKAYLVVVANGRYFGQGLFVAPTAEVDDGVLEVLVAPDMSLPRIMQVVGQVYRGTHIFNKRIKVGQGKEIRVLSQTGNKIGLDLDGEGDYAHEVVYTLKPRILMMNT